LAALGRPVFVLWLDAHADYNTPATTVTGNMHGMSAAFLCGEPGLDGLLATSRGVSISPINSICSESGRSIPWKEACPRPPHRGCGHARDR